FCNEFGWYQTAQPVSGYIESHSVYSKYVDVQYYLRLCRAYLNNPNQELPNTLSTNVYYGGLAITTSRILWINGDVDPWHWVSSYTDPTPGLQQTNIFIQGGHHCSDLFGRSNGDTAYTQSVFDAIFK
ncbi:hypothetical protein HDU76_011690, partial [Blyttiomyces sp. JEL0837]